MKDRDQIIAENPLVEYLQAHGHTFTGCGNEFKTLCFNHDDHNPSMRVNPSKGTYYCDVCQAGGSVIDAIMHYENLTLAEAMKSLGGEDEKPKPRPTAPPPPPLPDDSPFKLKPRLVETYAYENEVEEEVFRVCRFEPKTFRQGQLTPDDRMVWNLDGVRRVPYKLPQVLKAERIFIAEGERDVHALMKAGHVATCNPGGAGKWLDSYSEYFDGKEVIICPDNDEPGQKHAAQVRESVAKHAAWIKQLKIPAPHKDIRDYIEAGGKVDMLIEAAPKLFKGIHVPVIRLADVEQEYRRTIALGDSHGLRLEKWLPSLKEYRALVPGEILLVLGFTGAGKTALLQNIAPIAAPLTVLMFELELPLGLMYERQVGIERNQPGSVVELNYKLGQPFHLKKADHIFVCPESKITVDQMEEIIAHSELVIGKRPEVVMIDYIQLMKGTGDRYQRMSDIADNLKVLAKSMGVVLVIASQPSRPPKDKTPHLNLYSAKDSGNIENGAGMVIGLERDEDDPATATVTVFKCTKGAAGKKIICNFHPSLKITERTMAE